MINERRKQNPKNSNLGMEEVRIGMVRIEWK